MATENGFLIIADISGYTEFSIQSEIDHAEGVIMGLIGTILDAMKSPIKVSKLEGDAVFSYIPSDSFSQNQSLLEALDNIYIGFSDMLFQMQRNTSCPCNACINIKKLDLKIVMHHGQYALTEIAGGTELSGPDVIQVHRLMKNTIREKTGIDAYCFFTERSAEAMGLDEPRANMVAHREEIEQIGPVNGYVYSLLQAWEDFKEQRVIRVDPDTAWFTVSDVIPLPQAMIWDYMNDDDNWVVWSQTDVSKFERPESGKNGVGLEKHCVHGKDNFVQTIVDWRPFEYYTNEVVTNVHFHNRHTVVLEPVDGGTKVSLSLTVPEARNLLFKLMMKILFRKITSQAKSICRNNLTALREMVEADLAAGKIRPGY